MSLRDLVKQSDRFPSPKQPPPDRQIRSENTSIDKNRGVEQDNNADGNDQSDDTEQHQGGELIVDILDALEKHAEEDSDKDSEDDSDSGSGEVPEEFKEQQNKGDSSDKDKKDDGEGDSSEEKKEAFVRGFMNQVEDEFGEDVAKEAGAALAQMSPRV